MVVAKRVILMDWKSTLTPSFQKWLTETVAALKLEIICFSEINASKKFDQIWDPFFAFIFKSWTLLGHLCNIDNFNTLFYSIFKDGFV